MLAHMLLYDSGVSGNCYKVRLLLTLLGHEFEREELSVVDRSNRRDVIGDLNPALRVPTLVLDDGRPLAESNAIMWYFADGTEYVPEDRYEHAQVLQWLFFEQYSHEPNIAVLRFWTHYAPDAPDEAACAAALRRGGLGRRHARAPSSQTPGAGGVARAREEPDVALANIGDEVRR